MKTFSAKNETVQRDWYIVDADGKTLGRLATELARRLRGKHKPVYTPFTAVSMTRSGWRSSAWARDSVFRLPM